MSTITRDAWLAELERVMRHPGPHSDGLTSAELAERWGCCRQIVLERLRVLHDRLVVGRKSVQALDGRTLMVPCYKLVPQHTARKKR